MWWCGDDECDCLRPQVVVRYPLNNPKPGVGLCEVIAEGKFETYGCGHDDAKMAKANQEKWLEDARAWYFQSEPEQSKGKEGA